MSTNAAASLKDVIRGRLWEVADRDPDVLSATLTGSFLEAGSLEGVSDIDFVVVVDRLNAARYGRLLRAFDDALRPDLRRRGWGLRLNPTLGPLKFNDPQTAVLHLMFYDPGAHAEHVVNSPFTCLDWQRSRAYRKKSLAEVYPVFGLQPRHFLGARRSLQDYLRDFTAGVVSYRELICTEDGYREEKRGKPMTPRDRHEFAYHVQRFLMTNLLKLVHRHNEALTEAALLDGFFDVFPRGRDDFTPFYQRLRARKVAGDFAEPLPGLAETLQAFLTAFEEQFRDLFFTGATRHVVFRHAPTAANHGTGEDRVFLGRGDPPLDRPEDAPWHAVAEAAAAAQPRAAFASPLQRCRQSLAELARRVPLPDPGSDDRLIEINYGAVEGQTVAAARAGHPGLFAAWERGEDPRFPGGESTGDVAARARAFVRDRWVKAPGGTVTCTHNVVLRCLLGQTLGVPRRRWHALRVPHLAPVTFVQTRRFGLFVDIPEAVERELFRGFAEGKGE